MKELNFDGPMIPRKADSKWLDISCPLFELVRGDEISWIQKYGRKVVQIIQSIPRKWTDIHDPMISGNLPSDP